MSQPVRSRCEKKQIQMILAINDNVLKQSVEHGWLNQWSQYLVADFEHSITK